MLRLHKGAEKRPRMAIPFAMDSFLSRSSHNLSREYRWISLLNEVGSMAAESISTNMLDLV
jgi:hypothetical protein